MAPLGGFDSIDQSPWLFALVGVSVSISMLVSLLICAGCCTGKKKKRKEAEEPLTHPTMSNESLPISIIDRAKSEPKHESKSAPIPVTPKTETKPETIKMAKKEEILVDNKPKGANLRPPFNPALLEAGPPRQVAKLPSEPKMGTPEMGPPRQVIKTKPESSKETRPPPAKVEFVSAANHHYKTVATNDNFEPSVVKKATPAKEAAQLSFVSGEDVRYHSFAGIDDVFAPTIKPNPTVIRA